MDWPKKWTQSLGTLSLFHNFIDLKKMFDIVWHAGLWQVLRSFNIDEELVQAIQALYKNSSSVVFLKSQLRAYFKTTVGVRQGCLLSSILLNLFLEKIMRETLHDRHTSISIGGGGSNVELQDPTNTLVDRAAAYGMKSAQKRA